MSYCTKCGRKLIWKQDEAQKHIQDYYSEWKFDKYNAETGKQQYVGWWECPKYHWWNGHDSLREELI